ncbi:ESCRT-II complex subunit-domain-containing protein [Umbelopsis sp. AD052]|nr:ESCRT-II complex subunit-domain-containing protein [Umbelopsis sp. AD052]
MQSESNGYKFPAIHDFPPLYTRQPTESTWQNQVKEWERIILAYYRSQRLYRLNLVEATVPGASPLFDNTKIKRRLSLETLEEIVNEMVRKGLAEWVTDSNSSSKSAARTQALIYWRKPEEWSSLLWTWINEQGFNNSIMTVYEIANGEAAEGTDFYEMDTTVLIKALEVLSASGNAQIFTGTGDVDSIGVKFFGI